MISFEESTARDALAKLTQAASVRDGWLWDGGEALHDNGRVQWRISEPQIFVARRRSGHAMTTPHCFAAMEFVENGE